MKILLKKIFPYFSFLDVIFSSISQFFQAAGSFFLLCAQIFKECLYPPYYFKLVIEQLFYIGVRSFFLVLVAGLAAGSVMALQFGYGVAKFGGKLYVPRIIGLVILREMGPVFTSLLIAGRIGSG